jgi:hypothetical protein
MCSVPDVKTATGDCSWVKISEDTYAGSDSSWGTVSTIISVFSSQVETRQKLTP